MLCLALLIAGIALGGLVGPVVVQLVRSVARIVAPSSYCTNLAQDVTNGFLDEQSTYNSDCGPPYGFTRTWLLVLGVIVVLLVLAWLFRLPARLALRPLREMTGAVRDLGPQNLGQRITATGKRDEYGVLAREVNDMLGRVAIGFEGQRRFAANASHELRTPLAVQRTLVEVAMVTSAPDEDLRRLGAELLLVNERNEQLIEGLLVLAESDRGLTGTIPVALHELADAAMDAYVDLARERGVTLHRDLRPRVVPGDPVLLERLITNLVHNAIKYNVDGGRVGVEVGDSPALVVSNTGQQVPGVALGALFEPFRRLRSDRLNPQDGAGLGLSIVRSIAMAHNGTVRAAAREDGGLVISVELPS
ncbi:MAG TPA: HAMP domain-containing sensor histidine kinase [Pseudonocardiaceae bacterium]|nr:HAMP domain-containing sensor histidine kinase [Pseudonocardiaceae bacterium]